MLRASSHRRTRRSRNRRAITLSALAVFLFLFYLQPAFLRSNRAHRAAIRSAPPNDTTTSSSPPLSCPEEIDPKDYSPLAFRCRIQDARARAHSLLHSQSTTPTQATAEYQRRYGRDPPAGFSDWVQFALDHGSKVIDDFDQINRDLEPFRTPEAKELFSKFKQEEDWPNTRRVTFVDGVMKVSNQYYMYEAYWESLVAPFMNALPNNSVFYINAFDEPRILSKSGGPPSKIEFIDRNGESIEDLIKDSCAQIPRELFDRIPREKDVCQNAQPGKFHGLVASPSTLSYTHSLVPLLSIGRMSAFRDILIPCPCYVGHPIMEDDPVPFLDKKPAVYWRGSSTGLHAFKSTWRYGHRHRFVAFIQAIQNAAKVLDASRFFGATMGELVDEQRVKLFKDLFDVRMARYVQCERDGDTSVCDDMERVLGPVTWDSEDVIQGYRYLFDLDGNNMSTRLYRLLSTQSVVLKQTWFQEWHDDRLMPWVHYVPVTMEMEELPSLMNFLINDPEGEGLSGEIASAGYKWSREVFREIDMSIYVYRLFLELAEIYGPVQTTK